ncbi:fungal-specific transcription factor domain-containing protein [Aspergillus pseudoustus]|uniref:Fungal-specific transcription factor domain-containing protein n=1 Tax=Aspergillus pseudoustus TaxID=1810923 RepID=A0ABR4KFP4_9EURO
MIGDVPSVPLPPYPHLSVGLPAHPGSKGLATPDSSITSASHPTSAVPYWPLDGFKADSPGSEQVGAQPGELETWAVDYPWPLSPLETCIPHPSCDLWTSDSSTPYSPVSNVLQPYQAPPDYGLQFHSGTHNISPLSPRTAKSPAREGSASFRHGQNAMANNQIIYSASSTVAACLEECLNSYSSFDALKQHRSLFAVGDLSNTSSTPRTIPRLLAQLPEIGHAADGIHAYFENFHPIYPFIDPLSFRHNWPALYTTGQDTGLDPVIYSAFCLVVAIGTLSDASDGRVKGRQDVVTGLQCKTWSLLGDVINSPQTQSVQVLLLHTILQFQLGNESLAWMMCGIASRMAQSLDLHCDAPNELARGHPHLWPCIFTLDTFLSALEGKPTTFTDTVLSQKLHSLGCRTKGLRGDSNMAPTLAEMFYWRVELARVYERYCVSIQKRQLLQCQIATLLDLDTELTKWKEEAPPNLRPGHAIMPTQPLDRLIAILHLDYYLLLCSIQWAIALATGKAPEIRSSHPEIRIRSCEDICLSSARSFIDVLNGIASAYEGSRVFSIAFHSQSCIMILAILYQAVVRHPRRITAKADFESFHAGKTHLERHASPSKLTPALRGLLDDMMTSAERFLAEAQLQGPR